MVTSKDNQPEQCKTCGKTLIHYERPIGKCYTCYISYKYEALSTLIACYQYLLPDPKPESRVDKISTLCGILGFPDDLDEFFKLLEENRYSDKEADIMIETVKEYSPSKHLDLSGRVEQLSFVDHKFVAKTMSVKINDICLCCGRDFAKQITYPYQNDKYCSKRCYENVSNRLRLKLAKALETDIQQHPGYSKIQEFNSKALASKDCMFCGMPKKREPRYYCLYKPRRCGARYHHLLLAMKMEILHKIFDFRLVDLTCYLKRDVRAYTIEEIKMFAKAHMKPKAQ